MSDSLIDIVEQVLIGGAHQQMGSFVADALVQHDLRIAHGPAAWAQDLTDRAVVYTEIFKLIGQGNFVVTYCKVTVADEPYAVFDIYRLHAGQIVERWVNAEIVVANTGNSGKF